MAGTRITLFNIIILIVASVGISFIGYMGYILVDIYGYYNAMSSHSSTISDSFDANYFISEFEISPNPIRWEDQQIIINEAWLEKYSEYYTIVLSIDNSSFDITTGSGRPWFRLLGEKSAFALTGTHAHANDLYTYLFLDSLEVDTLELLIFDASEISEIVDDYPPQPTPQTLSLKDIYVRMLEGLELDTLEVITRNSDIDPGYAGIRPANSAYMIRRKLSN